MSIPPQATPNTAAPAVAAVAEVVQLLGCSRDTTWLKVRKQPIIAIDFYAQPINGATK